MSLKCTHENTYLHHIYKQLQEDPSGISDRDELCKFILSITKPQGDSEDKPGVRNMIDMLELVKKFYYDPSTRGSNSIKNVLPAMLNSSEFLQNKYSQKIYGAENGIKSLNYRDWEWIKYENGCVIDPYKLLPKIFQDITDNEYELLSNDDELCDGGAALTAYVRMQFDEMNNEERDNICKALYRYCELDTMAMVMIYEGWKDMIK
jgi:hypothetical protein